MPVTTPSFLQIIDLIILGFTRKSRLDSCNIFAGTDENLPERRKNP